MGQKNKNFSLQNRLNHVFIIFIIPYPSERIYMSNITKISINREFKRIEKNSFWEQHFLYPIFFREDFYGIAYNHFVDNRNYRKNKVYGFNNHLNFMTLKRLIRKLRRSNYSWIDSDQSTNRFQIVQEIFIIVFNSISSIESELVPKKTNEWESNQSLHSIFPFMEDKFYNSTICLDITIPYCFHTEILIRLFRKHVSDTSFSHFSRLLLHQKENIAFSPSDSSLRKNEFYNSLWNFEIHKFEYSLIDMWEQIYNYPSTSFRFYVDQTNFLRKIKYILDSKQTNSEPTNKSIEKTYSIHYARYENTLIVSTNGNLNLFVENWTLFFMTFWEKYFHLWSEPCRVSRKDLSKNNVCFLGYLLRIGSNSRSIQIQLVDNSIDADLTTKEFCTIVPIVPLIRLLAREKFCDTSGRPICRMSWTTLTDHEIFERFDQIIRNIFFHYSGAVGKKGLYQLHYILRFSCAKTLACKHKSTIRTVWKKYGSNFAEKSVYLKKPQLVSWRIHEKKNWYLNIIQMNYLAHSPRKFGNVRNF